MFERYIVINESRILAGQNSSGIWYCKELPAQTVTELDRLIGEVNSVLNKYNKTNKDIVLKTDTGGIREMNKI